MNTGEAFVGMKSRGSQLLSISIVLIGEDRTDLRRQNMMMKVRPVLCSRSKMEKTMMMNMGSSLTRLK